MERTQSTNSVDPLDELTRPLSALSLSHPFPYDAVDSDLVAAVKLFGTEKARWKHSTNSKTYRTAELILQRLEILHKAIRLRSDHLGDLFVELCKVLEDAPSAFRAPPRSKPRLDVRMQRQQWWPIVARLKTVAEGVQHHLYQHVQPHQMPENEFDDILSHVSSLRTSDDSTDDAISSAKEDMQELPDAADSQLAHDVPWTDCAVLIEGDGTSDASAAAICKVLFPFDKIYHMPSLLTVFEWSPESNAGTDDTSDEAHSVRPVVVLSGNAGDAAVQSDCAAVRELFGSVRIIQVPTGNVLAPLLPRDESALLQTISDYFKVVTDTLQPDEYRAVYNIRVQRCPVSSDAPDKTFAELHVDLYQGHPLKDREKMRLQATYSDLRFDERDFDERDVDERDVDERDVDERDDRDGTGTGNTDGRSATATIMMKRSLCKTSTVGRGHGRRP